MGLDMYLSAKLYVWNESPLQTEINELTKDIRKDLNIKGITAEAAYWRKANAIHQWFVTNVQDGEDDCREYYVSNEKLSELRDICVDILADTTKAADLLPPQEGFFFGSTNVDEWYFQDLEYTVEVLAKLLEPEYKDWEFYYRSSW